MDFISAYVEHLTSTLFAAITPCTAASRCREDSAAQPCPVTDAASCHC